MVFYRKYRPQKFADLVGQEHIRETLLSQLSSGKISHGYLFAGPRGTGKTSTARIFAKAVNCKVYQKQKFGEPCNKCVSCLAIADGSHLDLVEIDAASNRGIDEIRDLREKIKLSPISSRFKVYIIDEAHMLTTEAFNALLKTLEEPPAHAIFILATTAPNKLPATIISRLSRNNFSRAKESEIVSAITKVVKLEALTVDKEALEQIAKAADGSFRDAVSILDQLAAKGRKIVVKDVLSVGGVFGFRQILDFLEMLASQDLKSALLAVEKLESSGGDISLFIRELIGVCDKLLMIKVGATDELADFGDLSAKFSFSDLTIIMKLLLIAESEIKLYPLPKIPLILAVCKIIGEPQTGSQWDSNSVSRTPELSKKGKIKSLSAIETKWGEFLDKVRKENVHLFALLRSCKPAQINGDYLTIEVFYSFHKDKLEEPKTLKMLEDKMAQIYKSSVSLKFVLAKREQSVPKTVRESDVIEAGASDLSKVAAEIFNK